jgi:hypothetical protein
MQAIIRLSGLLIVTLALIVPTLNGAQDKKADDTKSKEGDSTTKAKDKDKEKVKIKPDWKGEIIGKLSAYEDKDDSGAEFTVHVKIKVPEANPDGQKQLASAQQSLLQHQSQLAQAKNKNDVQNALKAIQQDQVNIGKAQGNLIKYSDVEKDWLLKEKEGMRVRYFDPPQTFDEVGEPIKLSKEELKKLWGADGYVAFKSDKSVLKVGQTVHVFVHKDSALPDLSKTKGDDKTTAINNFRYEVIMIRVLENPPDKDKK